MNNVERIRDTKIKNIIFVSEGGAGKIIASTAVVKRIAEEFPDKRLIVVSGSPDIFLYNPHVHRVFRFDNPLYFYDDYVTEERIVIKTEPYISYEYLFDHRHLIDVWCRQIGIESKGAEPELFFLNNELEAAKVYSDRLTNEGKKKFILFQWVGGIIPKDSSKQEQGSALMVMHRRSLPKSVAQKVVNKLVSRDFVVGVVQHGNFPEIQGAQNIFFHPIRTVIALLKYSQGFIGIDSFLQHAGAALHIPGVVMWGGTNPKNLGYDQHLNLTREKCPHPFCHRPDSYMFDMNPANGMWNCPHNAICMEYDADEIIKAYESIFPGEKKEQGKDPGEQKKEG